MPALLVVIRPGWASIARLMSWASWGSVYPLKSPSSMPRARSSRTSCWMLMGICLAPGGDLDQIVGGAGRADGEIRFGVAGNGGPGRAGLDGAVGVAGEHLLADGGDGERLRPEVACGHQRHRLALGDVHRGGTQPGRDERLHVAVDEAGGDAAAGIGHRAVAIGPAEEAHVRATAAGDEG